MGTLKIILCVVTLVGVIKCTELCMKGKLKLLNMLMPPEIVTFKGRYLVRFAGGIFLGKKGTFRLRDIWVTPDYIEKNCYRSYDECKEAMIEYSGDKPEPKSDEELMMLDKNWQDF